MFITFQQKIDNKFKTHTSTDSRKVYLKYTSIYNKCKEDALRRRSEVCEPNPAVRLVEYSVDVAHEYIRNDPRIAWNTTGSSECSDAGLLRVVRRSNYELNLSESLSKNHEINVRLKYSDESLYDTPPKSDVI
jgi:uncharacterized protein YfaT (DUF1175 family)